jgi:hypothetical protein
MLEKWKPKILGFVWVSLLLGLSSCATVFGGKRNTVEVLAGVPEKAQVYLDGKFIGETPFKKRISKYKLQEGSIIEIRKASYQSEYFEVVRKPHTLYVLADILTGALPLIVDVANANIYRPNTNHIEYELKPMSVKKQRISEKPELQEKK